MSTTDRPIVLVPACNRMLGAHPFHVAGKKYIDAVRLASCQPLIVADADANPYVAIAATLACGYLGMKNRIEPSPECKGDAYLADYALPRTVNLALEALRDESALVEVLGERFVTVYTEIKEVEHAEFMKVISPWEREHLLLHV